MVNPPIQGISITLFGKGLLPGVPLNDQIISFDSGLNLWKIITNPGGGGEANTSSNVGTGDGLALPKVAVDLPFKSLVENTEVLIASAATELSFSIGSIAQAKIIGLVADLLTKIETSSNVGTGDGLALPKVGIDLPFKSLTPGEGIVMTPSPTEIEIKLLNVGKHITLFSPEKPKKWKLMPAALTEMFDVDKAIRINVSALNFTEARFFVRKSGILAFAGSEIHPQYDAGAGFVELASVVNALDIAIDVNGTFDTGFQPIAALAQVNDIEIRLVGSGGNGIVEPEFGLLAIEFK